MTCDTVETKRSHGSVGLEENRNCPLRLCIDVWKAIITANAGYKRSWWNKLTRICVMVRKFIQLRWRYGLYRIDKGLVRPINLVNGYTTNIIVKYMMDAGIYSQVTGITLLRRPSFWICNAAWWYYCSLTMITRISRQTHKHLMYDPLSTNKYTGLETGRVSKVYNAVC